MNIRPRSALVVKTGIAALVMVLITGCAMGGAPGGATDGAPGSAPGSPPPALDGQDRLGLAIDSMAASAVDGGDVVGVTVAVLRGGEQVRVQGYGTANLEAFSPATDSTRYYVGSITKTITAAAILRLVEQGRLSLDDDVVRHVPELEGSGPPITIRHLLTHTSGLPGPQHVAGRFLERRHLPFSRDQLLGLLEGEPRVAAPGEQFAYNNLGYIVLGIVLERVSGESYEEHLRRGVLEPAAATSVLLCDPQRVIPHRATGYVKRGDEVVHHEPVNASLVFAAGGLCANAGDVARWFRALALGRVVSPGTFQEMATLQSLTDGTRLPYGYGLLIDEVDGSRRVHHGGDVNGFSSHAAFYPDHDLTVVVLTNTRGPAAREIEQRIARLAITDRTRSPPGTPGRP